MPKKQYVKKYPEGKYGRPTKWTEDKALDLVNDLIAWLKSAPENKYFETYLYEIRDDVFPDLIGYLTGKYDTFHERLKLAKRIQLGKLKRMAEHMRNPALPIFLMKANHDYVEKQYTLTQKIETTHKKAITVEQVQSMSEEELQSRMSTILRDQAVTPSKN